MRRRLVAGGALLAVTLALHAAVLAWAQASLRPGAVRALSEHAPIRSIQVNQRAGAGAAGRAPATTAALPAAAPDPLASATLPEPTASAPAPEPPLAPVTTPPDARRPDPAAEPGTLPPPVEPDPALPSAQAFAGDTAGPSDGAAAARLLQDYHPGRELTRRPQLLTAIPLELQIPGFRPDPTARLRMRLLIGADGRVDHVLTEASNLDPLARERAIEQFQNARYAPGEIQGEAVRSQVLIEVGFSGR